jgi:acetoin:2,6-dichlorophenolindophenol oxidoreductase subunit beta
MKEVTFGEAIRDSIHYALQNNPDVIVLGEGIDDPKGIDGTVLGLYEEFGKDRVIDLPIAENGCMGVAIGSSIVGMLPIIIHQRMDFLLMAMDQILNHAAKWNYMFGGNQSIPLVIKCTVGQGWGMGPTHSQSLHALFSHMPGIKIVMPSNPYDAKGLFLNAIEDSNPVIFVENYKCYATKDNIPMGKYTIDFGQGKIVKEGSDLTIVTCGYLVHESLKAAEIVAKDGIKVEVLDLRSLYPLDENLILQSVSKTGRLIVADPGHKTNGLSAEICAIVSENIQNKLLSNVIRVAFPDAPIPASSVLEQYYYPMCDDIVDSIKKLLPK